MRKIFSFPTLILIVALISSFALMLNSSLQESAIMDELAHIPAGYGYVKYFDYRLNPEHPPLVKALAAIPLVFQSLNFPTQSPAWQNDINGQWVAGAQFLYESGNDADSIINWSRLFPMILTLILTIFVYLWSQKLMGKWWALLPAILTAFSPSLLAHGHYVTTDIGASLGILISLYYFSRYIQKSPTPLLERGRNANKDLIISGVTFGIAQLMKFSSVLIIPLFLFLILVLSINKAYRNGNSFFSKIYQFIKHGFNYLGSLILIFIVGYILVYIVYFAFTFNYPIQKQQSDTTAILSSFGEGPGKCSLTNKDAKTPESQLNYSRCLADLDIYMSGNRLLRPWGEYLLGVMMVMQRASGGNTSYFLGQVSSTGWWYYFPVIFLLKEPIPSLILIAFAFLLGLYRFASNFKSSSLKHRFFNYIENNFAEFSMFSFIVLYWVYSMRSTLNIGVRHILPTLPLIYILSSQSIKNWAHSQIVLTENVLKNFFNQIFAMIKTSAKNSMILILVIWYIIETLVAAPYFLSYFNEFAGGPWGGYQYIVDSNYDWGQDLKRLGEFTNNPPAGEKIDKIALEYFGGGNVKYYLGDKVINWQSSKGNPKDSGIQWFAVSINNLQNAIGKIYPGQERKAQDEYRWLNNPLQPDYRVGTSIFIYKL